jgi:hypothetical protein
MALVQRDGARLDLSVSAGTDAVIPATITTSGGVPVDLTGSTLTAWLHDRDGTVLETLAVVVVSAVAGTITITVPRSLTALYRGRSIPWALDITGTDSLRRPYLRGRLVVVV